MTQTEKNKMPDTIYVRTTGEKHLCAVREESKIWKQHIGKKMEYTKYVRADGGNNDQ